MAHQITPICVKFHLLDLGLDVIFQILTFGKTFFLSQTSLLIQQFTQMAWLGFYIYKCPNSYAASGNRTHVSEVTLNSWDLLKDALPTELHSRGKI